MAVLQHTKLIAAILAAVGRGVVLYPFFFHREDWDISESKSSPQNLDTRWENALAGIRNTELEHAIGSLSEKDYQVLRDIYLNEAAIIIKSMELQHERERELINKIDVEVKRVRENFLGKEPDLNQG